MNDRSFPENVPLPEPGTVSLSAGGQLFVWGIRQWLVAAREKRCVKQELMIPYYRLECMGAIYHLDAMMRILLQGATRRLEVRCPDHPLISADERLLLILARARQQENDEAAAVSAGKLVDPLFESPLTQAATDYARQLSTAGLSLSTAPQLELVAGAGP